MGMLERIKYQVEPKRYYQNFVKKPRKIIVLLPFKLYFKVKIN